MDIQTTATARRSEAQGAAGAAGPVSGRKAGRSSLGGAFPGDCEPSQPGSGAAGQPGSKGECTFALTFETETRATSYQTETETETPAGVIATLFGIHPELPLTFCPDCDSRIPYIPRMVHCAYTCDECGTKWEWMNGSLKHLSKVPQIGVDRGRVRLQMSLATLEIEEVVIKPTVENTRTCIECDRELDGFSIRVSRFSHVGSREIQEKTYPYLSKKVYFPVYVKGRMCEACIECLRSDVKEVGDKTIGIWRDADDREVNILMERESNTTMDNQSMKGMSREIKDNRESDTPANSFTLMRIEGVDEPVVLSFFQTKGNKVDVSAYNALFGKRQVNRYGRHVVEPSFNDREK